MPHLRDTHPGYHAVSTAMADWYLVTGVLLQLAGDKLLSAGTYDVLAEAVHFLTIGIIPDDTVTGMRAIGILFVALGATLRFAVLDTTARKTAFRIAWAAAATIMFTWAAGFTGAILTGDSTGITGAFTYLTMVRIMVAGMSEPLENPARPNGLRRGDG